MNLIKFLRVMGLLDGVSLLTLVLIAMPFKYFLDIPIVVTINGAIHGAIFSAYVLTILVVQLRVRWNIGWSIVAFIVAFIPFGNFVFDMKLKKMQPDLQSKPLYVNKKA